MTVSRRRGGRAILAALVIAAFVAAPAASVAAPAAPAPAAAAPVGAAAVAAPATSGPAVAAPGVSAPPAGAALPRTGDALVVQVLTFGPGNHPFTKFGHNAIRIVDRIAGRDVVYNFGTFVFDSPRLIVDFLQGRLRYWLSRASMAATVRTYRRENRSIEVQELALSPDQKRALFDRLEVNARPENRDYRYDYFADNCSTRVRDAVDGVLGGRLRAAASAPGTMSLRAHALRMAADDVPLYTALLIVLGPRADRPIDQWAETFLPEMLQRTFRRATMEEIPVAGGGGGAGAGALGAGAGAGAGAPRRPVVEREGVLFTPDRPPPLRESPKRWPAFLTVGIGVGLLFAALGGLGSRWKVARVLFGGTVAVAGLVLGGIGCFLVGAWAFTPHTIVYGNQNILLFAPFAIALVVLGMGAALGRVGATRKTYLLAAAALGLAVIAGALKLLPLARQENGALIVLLVPIWFGLAVGAKVVAPRRGDAR